MRDYMDNERDRRLEDIHHRQQGSGGGGGDGFDDILELFAYIVFGAVVLMGIAGFLDNQFGWGLTDWLMGLLRGLMSG